MNEKRKKENDLKVKFNNGTISFEKYANMNYIISQMKKKKKLKKHLMKQIK